MKITFLGATGTVTGSKYLIESGTHRALVDCGLFQGLKQLRLKNWKPLPVDPAKIDVVVLTHAHIDHTGYLPLLVKNGFSGKVYCSHATKDLCEILLPDSAHLQEEEARYANMRGFSKHHPALPLYTQEDAERALEMLVPVEFDEDVQIAQGLSARFSPSGHILGASMIMLRDADRSILFSGDMGRPNDPLMLPPAIIKQADYLVLESTYGDRLHDNIDPEIKLAEIINRTYQRGGVLVVPVFAVGRAQELLYFIQSLKTKRMIPDMPVYLNSPMAVDATEIFMQHADKHKLSKAACKLLANSARMVNSVEESRSLNEIRHPVIILSASGMASGGRVVHHIKAFGPDPRNTILFAGYQAVGTRGAAMLGGAESVKIHGEYVPINAEVDFISNLSAHADYSEMLDWLGHFEKAPIKTFLTHGEPVAADTFRRHIEEKLTWDVVVPEYLETIAL
ncbi:MAG: MBL fold metallo-hydrolase [Methylophilaceae bacterium]|nr:MBL fold metallo-hydrolase [Methylophilaceae bacterium]